MRFSELLYVIVDEKPPVENKTTEPQKSVEVKTDDKSTGNPILVLLAILALLGVGIKRRK